MGDALLLFNISRPQRLTELSNMTQMASRTLAGNSRMFYVALSRPQHALVFAHPRGRGIATHGGIDSVITRFATPLRKADLAKIPEANLNTEELPKSYSYTSDYLLHQKCPRQYMVFRKYGFVPSRSQTMLFGSLVHKTLEDLHHFLIDRRAK